MDNVVTKSQEMSPPILKKKKKKQQLPQQSKISSLSIKDSILFCREIKPEDSKDHYLYIPRQLKSEILSVRRLFSGKHPVNPWNDIFLHQPFYEQSHTFLRRAKASLVRKTPNFKELPQFKSVSTVHSFTLPSTANQVLYPASSGLSAQHHCI